MEDTERPYMRPRDLGDGLVLRWSSAEDVQRIGELAAYVFRQSTEQPNTRQIAWARDLGSGRHPICGPGHAVVVEDTRARRLVASMWHIPQRWSYEGIVFGVGRPEQVVSLPEYRGRGLVRALFDAFHLRSQAEGDLAQAITGIPYFYRQFGYEYALALDGSRTVRFDAIPALKAGEPEPLQLRDATPEDVPYIADLYNRSRAPLLASTEVPDAYWRWVFFEVSEESGQLRRAALVVDGAGERRGFVGYFARRWDAALGIRQLVLDESLSLLGAVGPLLRALRERALVTTMMPGRPEAAVDRIGFNLGPTHPFYDALPKTLVANVEQPYAWYVRVPDVVALLRHIRPVLEHRLAASPAAHYTGELLVDLFRMGLRLRFQDGKITTIDPWQRLMRPHPSPEPGAGFPPLVFLQLLFGYRGLVELDRSYPDVWADGDAPALLDALFPKRPSNAMDLD